MKDRRTPAKARAKDTSKSDGRNDGFGALRLDDHLLSTLVELGYEEPTPIQREAIPVLLAGQDVLAEAPTGASGDRWEAVRLPYYGASMIAIVPTDGSFAEIDSGIDPDFVAGVISALDERVVTLGLPRWKSESRANLIPPLETMGIVDLFDDHNANLRGIADIEQMWIEKAIHMANVTVDETGTEAAAATALVGQVESAAAPVTLTVDRPFIYLIRDEKNGEILFMGRLVQP